MAYLRPDTNYINALLQADEEQAIEADRRKNQNTGAFGDAVTSFEQGLYSVPSGLTGLADTLYNLTPPGLAFPGRPFSTAADAVGDFTGLDFDRWAKEQENEYSDEYLRQRAEVEAAKGLDVVPAWLSNPRVATGDILGSLPAMFSGGVLGAAARKAIPKLSGLAAAGVGEGAIMAGLSMADMEEAGVDPRLAAALSTGVGVIGAAIGVGGGTLARRYKVDDPEVFLQQLLHRDISETVTREGAEALAPRAALSDIDARARRQLMSDATGLERFGSAAARAGIGGAIEAGEEFAQSATEKAALNVGTGAPIEEGTLTQGLRGALSGAALGAGTNIGSSGLTELGMRAAEKGDRTATGRQTKLNEQLAEQHRQERERLSDPFHAEIARRKAAAEEARVAGVATLLGTPGVGPSTIDKLGGLKGVESIEDLQELVASKSNKEIPTKRKEAILNGEYAKSLPTREEVAAQKAAEASAWKQQVEQGTDDALAEDAEPAPTTEQESVPTPDNPQEQDAIEGLEDLAADDAELLAAIEETLSGGQEQSRKASIDSADTKLSLADIVATEPDDKVEKPLLGNRALGGLVGLLNDFTEGRVQQSRKQRLKAARLHIRDLKGNLAAAMGNKMTHNRRVTAAYRQQSETHQHVADLVEMVYSLSTPGGQALTDRNAALEDQDTAAAEAILNVRQERARLADMAKAVAAVRDANMLTVEARRNMLMIIGAVRASYDFKPRADVQALVEQTKKKLGLNDPAQAQTAERLVSIFDQIRALTNTYDALGSTLLQNPDRKIVLEKNQHGLYVTKLKKRKADEAVSGDLEPALEESGAARVGTKLQELEAVEAATEGLDIPADRQGRGAQVIDGTVGIARELQSLFAELESIVGRNNIKKAQALSKDLNPRFTNKQGGEQSSATRFSQLYAEYWRTNKITPYGNMQNPIRESNVWHDYNARTGKPMPETEGRIPADRKAEDKKTLRKTSSNRVVKFQGATKVSVTKYDNSDQLNEQAPFALERIINDAKIKYDEPNPILALLQHIGRTDVGSPMARVLASGLYQALSTGDRTHVDSMTLVLEGRSKSSGPIQGEYSFSYFPSGGKDSRKRITLYDNATMSVSDKEKAKRGISGTVSGFTNEVILHEILHSVTTGILSRPESTLTPKQLAAKNHVSLLGLGLTKLIIDRLSKVTSSRTADPKEVARLTGLFNSLLGGNEYSVDEFVSMSMTNRAMAEFMRGLTVDEVTKYLDKADRAKLGRATSASRNLWKRFVGAIKGLVGLSNIEDNFLGRAMEAQGDLLGEVYVAARRHQEIFDVSVHPSQKKPAGRGKKQARSAAIDLSTFPTTAATIAAQLELDRQSGRRADQRRGERAETDAAARREETLRAQEAQKEQRFLDRERAEQVTATPPPPAGKSKAFIISRMEEGVMNTVARLISAGRYNSWQEMVADRFEWVGKHIRDFVADPKEKHRIASTVLGTLLVNTVDEFGLNQDYKGAAHRAEAASDGIVSSSVAFYDALVTLDDKTQDALLDVIDNPTETTLLGIYGSDKDGKERADKVMRLYESLVDLKAQMAAEGLLAKDQMDWPLSRFLDLSTRGEMRIKARFGAGKAVRPPSDNFEQDRDVPWESVLDLNGDAISDLPPKGTKFWRMATNDPSIAQEDRSAVYVEVGADEQLITDKQLVFINDRNQYEYSTDGSSITMRRRLTPQEIRDKQGLGAAKKGRGAAQVTAALANLTQDWGRKVEGARMVRHLVAINGSKDTPQDSKFMLAPVAIPSGLSEAEKEAYDDRPEELKHLPPDKFIRPETKAGTEWKTTARMPGTWVRIPDSKDTDMGKQHRAIFGALAGQYVAGPVYSSMMDYQDDTPTITPRMYRGLMRMWKKNKTVYSPVAHINNIASNFVLAYYHDLPPENFKIAATLVLNEMFPDWKFMRKRIDTLRAKGYQIEDMLNEKNTVGITLGQMKTADLDVDTERAMEEWLQEKQDASPRGMLRSFIGFSRASTKIASDLYSNQDNIFRYATYITYLQNHGNIQPDGSLGLPQDRARKVKEDAALAAKEAFVNYRVHAPWIRGARDTMLPFVTWSYRMAPLMTKLMLQKPWKAANTAIAIYGVNALAYGLSGGDEEDERGLLPGYMQEEVDWLRWAPHDVPTTIRLPWNGEDNAPMFLNVSRMVPLADMFSANNSGTPQQLAFGGPLSIFMNLNSNYDPFRGTEISDETQTGMAKGMDLLKFGASAALPGLAVNVANATGKLGVPGVISGNTKPLGTRYSPWVQAAKVAGFNVYKMDVPEAAYAKEQEVDSIRRTFQTQMAKRWRAEFRELDPNYEDMIYDQEELQKDMERAVLKAYNLDPADYGLE